MPTYEHGLTSFMDPLLESGAKAYITANEIKRLKQEQKRAEEEFKYRQQKDQDDRDHEMAVALFEARREERLAKEEAERPLKGGERKAEAEAEILETYLQPIKDKVERGEEITQEDIDKLYMFRSYRKGESTVSGGAGAGGGKGGKKLGLDDINKTYRKDFIHEDAQKWMANVSSAAQNQEWDTFMKLGQDIQGLETRISQGIAGTSEAVKSQISSATAYWQSIFENLYPESLKTGGTKTPQSPMTGVGLGRPPTDEEVDSAWEKAEQGDRADLEKLYDTYGPEMIENIMERIVSQ